MYEVISEGRKLHHKLHQSIAFVDAKKNDHDLQKNVLGDNFKNKELEQVVEIAQSRHGRGQGLS